MELKKLSKEELEKYIEKFQDRIETLKENIYDNYDDSILPTLHNHLQQYENTLNELIKEGERRITEAEDQKVEYTDGRINLQTCNKETLELVIEYKQKLDSNWSKWLPIIETWNNGSAYRMVFKTYKNGLKAVGQIDINTVQTREDFNLSN